MALSARGMSVSLMDQATQIFFRDGELRDHLFDFLRRDAFQCSRHGFLAKDTQLLEQRPRRRG